MNIFKVIEYYDWHNSDPEIEVSVFKTRESAIKHLKFRVKKIKNDLTMMDENRYQYCDSVEKRTNKSDYVVMETDREDYITISMLKDELFD